MIVAVLADGEEDETIPEASTAFLLRAIILLKQKLLNEFAEHKFLNDFATLRFPCCAHRHYFAIYAAIIQS